MTRDEGAAFTWHVYTAVGAGAVVAVAFSFMGQEDADRVIELVKQAGEGVGIVVGAIAALLPIINALRASPTAQIRKVESLPDVTVVPMTPKGAEQIEASKKN
jgi:hypothetical protein